MGARRATQSGARVAARTRSWPALAWYALFAAVLLLQLGPGNAPAARGPAFGACLALLQLLGLAYAARAGWARAVDARTRRAWRLLALTWVVNLGTTVGFGLSGAAANVHGGPWMWLAIGCRLVMVPLLLAAVLVFPTRRLTRRERYKFGLDIATVVGGGFMLMWYFTLGPALRGHHPADVAVMLCGFPVGDLALVFGICAVLLRGGIASVRHPLAILVSGLALYLAGDVYSSYLGVNGSDALASPVLRLFLLSGAFLMALAAARQVRAGAVLKDGTSPRYFGTVPQLPYLALGLGYLLLVVATAKEGNRYPWTGLVAGVIVMTGAVAVRQMIAMRENQRLAVTDVLTGLANRVRLRARLQQAVDRHENTAVLVIDLDGFKQVNDTMGHEAGDLLLVAFADVLRRVVRQSDTAGRLGGDEFAVLLHGVDDVEHARGVADRILGACTFPVQVGDGAMPLRASIGITLSGPSDTPHDLMRRADAAMYAAKRARGHSWVVYDPGLDQRQVEDQVLAEDLETAAVTGQLRVMYQPIVSLAGGGLSGVEALVRWQHPVRGLIPPTMFIPLAEETGAIHGIGMWVLEQAAAQVAGWQALMPEGERMYASVNLSPRQLQRPGLVADILAILARTGLSPRDLVLELTEGALVNEHSGIPVLRALREHGIRIAVDDFGTGYSSLRYLTRLPIDTLKLDRCFVNELNGTPEGSAVAEAVIRLGQILHLDTVAEGIEEPAQAAELTLLGCRSGQGYLFARPMDAGALGTMIESRVAG